MQNTLARSRSFDVDDNAEKSEIPRSASFCSDEVASLTEEPEKAATYFLAVCRSATPQITMTPAFQAIKDSESKNYLSDIELEKYRVDIRDGIFYHGDLPLTGQFIYALMPNNILYAAPASVVLHHSYLSQGKAVKGTGMLYFCSGYLVTLSNESGHYKPSDDEMKYTLKWFYERNNTSSYIFEDHAHLNSEMVFDGIRYYKMECHNNVIFSKRIGLKELLPALKKQLKGIGDKIMQQRIMLQQSASTSASSSDENLGRISHNLANIGLSDVVPYEDTITPITQPVVKLPLREEILDSVLIYYTCLSIFKHGTNTLSKDGKPLLHSRFAGKPMKK